METVNTSINVGVWLISRKKYGFARLQGEMLEKEGGPDTNVAGKLLGKSFDQICLHFFPFFWFCTKA